MYFKKSKNGSLISVALAVDHQMTTGMAQHLVSNTGDVPDDHCVVQCHTSNMGKTKKQGDHWGGMVPHK